MKLFSMVKLVILAIIAIGLIAWVAWFGNKGKDKFYVNTSSANVVKQLQALNRYEAAMFTIEKVIDAGTAGNKFEQFLFGDQLLLIAHGQVIAGFDLSNLQADDVQVDGQNVKVKLPAPQILVTRLDSEKTRVYDRKQGLLTKGDKELESKARAAAEESITSGACEGKILDEASKNARLQLTAILKSAGFNQVTVEIQEGKCR